MGPNEGGLSVSGASRGAPVFWGKNKSICSAAVPGGELSYDLWGHGGRALRSPDGPDGLGARATQSPVREDERVKLLRDRDQDVLYARPSVALPFELASNASPGVPGSTCDAR